MTPATSLTSCIHSLPEPLHSAFVLQEKLGSGSFALVYRAQHRQSEESFALKVVQKDQLEARQMLHQLRREVEFSQALSGAPHIVQLLEVVDTRERVFLRFELCGVNLEDLIQATGPVRTEDALRWTREAAEGLSWMHRLGQVHRDIKPSNMLMDAEGSVKICDLGWACLEHERQVGACGSDAYAPPEQLTQIGQPHTNRSDIYSLGVSLQHFLLGRIPLSVQDVPYGREAEVYELLSLMLQPVPMSRPSVDELLMRPELASSLLERLWKHGAALLTNVSLTRSPAQASTRASSPCVQSTPRTSANLQAVSHFQARVACF